MKPETFTSAEKREIAFHIKPIAEEDIHEEMQQLQLLRHAAHTKNERCRLGNNIVDFFTFVHRLETKGKYNVNFFEFLSNLETFQKKKFIQTMLHYYKTVKNKNNTKHPYKVYKEVYNICISAINIMRPLNCMEVFSRYRAKRVLNFCAGWGGSTVAAAALQLEAWYGIEINHSLQTSYQQLTEFLQPYAPSTHMQIWFEDAATFDYHYLDYDTVFASPPYYFIEQYANNVAYTSKEDMDTRFYKPVFARTFLHLRSGGHYIINICKEVYDRILQPMLGNAHEQFPLKKSKRQNNHTEMVYVWKKI